MTALGVSEVVCASSLAVLGGMYWGPWIALTRTMGTFDAATFLAVLTRLNRSMRPAMTLLVPIALATTVPVLVLAYSGHRTTFVCTAVALGLFVVTVIVTMAIEVPIVVSLDVGDVAALPADWERRRDRWGAFHLLRVAPALVGLVLVLVGMAS